MVERIRQLPDDPSFPIKATQYHQWLQERAIRDTISNRLRYFAYVDARQRQDGTADEPWEVDE